MGELFHSFHLVGASHGSEEPNGCPTMLETEETQDSVEMTEREREREREQPELSLYFRVKGTKR